ncbi:hypothetical protein M404DRAFT_297818 [Pisolithus tinctorius Marx 270]|uniref:Uncharacterized protein n=1 Tax=Pisolithus tinctorius Marx 270 TaxID=870435 RepID=A0A0C3IFB9_PISTI|nr:hypothetical protein M404DRAFT_297818 [Pisolithus tinctorius Marx 270]
MSYYLKANETGFCRTSRVIDRMVLYIMVYLHLLLAYLSWSCLMPIFGWDPSSSGLAISLPLQSWQFVSHVID